MIRTLLLLAILWFPLGSLFAQNGTEPADPFPAKLEEDLSIGTSAIYLLDFAGARRHFRHAIELDSGHPAAYFFHLMSIWYELTYDSLMNRNTELEKALDAQAELTVRKAEAYAQDPKTEAVADLYWGGALGAKGWYHVTRNQWVRAYFSGKKGYNYMTKVLEIDPAVYDAYLGVGMYEYYAATLGPTLRVLASFAVRGDRDEALRYLNLALKKSRYVKLEAAYFLWNAAVEEGRLDEGLERAKFLKESFPLSPLFRWCEIYTLYQQKKWSEVLQKSEEYMALAQAGPQPENYENLYEKLLAKIDYHCGMAALQMGKIQLAKIFFDKTIDQKAEFQGWKILAYLRRGEIFDSENKRMEALVKYRAVLRYPNVWDSHKTARRRIKEPYQEK